MKKPVTLKTWDDFRNAGMLFFINSILHAFGWALVVEVDQATNNVTNCFPARVTFRGFNEQSQSEEHIKIAEYLAENSHEFVEEAKS
jgi:hypothetical protein